MPFRLRLFALFLLAVLFLPLGPRAQTQSDGTLHVVRPSINAEQDTAELCLEFDHALDRTSPDRILSGINLRSEGKTITIAPSNINLGATSLCVQSLTHRRDYSLTVSDLRGAGGEKLTEAYKLSFTVPDRHSSLAFAGDSGSSQLARLKDNDPVLRAINVERATVSLFRIDDSAQMTEAYRQRLLTTLAPSESFLFAKDKAKLIWQGDLVLDDQGSDKSANRNLEHSVPLHSAVGNLPPALYLVVAEDAEKPPKSADTDNLTPIAARWFLRSDLKIRGIRTNDGISIATEKADNTAVMKDIHLVLASRDNKTIAEATSDANGLAFLPIAGDKAADAAIVIGSGKTGDIDFADLTVGENISSSPFTVPDVQAAITANRSFYEPGSEAYLTLTIRGASNQAIAENNSSLQLLRPDHSLYASVPVPEGKAGVFTVPLSMPVLTGLWTAVWQSSDGRELAKSLLRVTSNPDAPQFSMTGDRTVIGNDGEINLSLRSTNNNNDASPYLAGHIWVQWNQPDNFPGWNDYHFGLEEKNDKPAVPAAAFITDASGNAKVHLNLKPPEDGAPLHTALISLRSDPAAGALDPESLTLGIKPNNYIVGIKPLAPNAKFAENSIARFDVIVLDGDGKRREDSGLKYQIYEEGRSFSWYQAEGRWEYKPLQQRRRVGGDTFDIKASGPTIIRWPVTAGSYVLEITDTNGVVLSRLHFYAGWGFLKADQTNSDSLALSPDSATAQPGTPVRAKFKLDYAAVITAVIADDKIRKIVHEAHNAGNNQITITPDESWGNRLRIRIETQQKTDNGLTLSSGQLELPLHHQRKELSLTAEMPGRVTGGQDLAMTLAIGNIDKKQPTFATVVATPLTQDESPPALFVRDVAVGADGKAALHFTVPVFSGTLRIAITAANQFQQGQKELSVPVDTAFTADMRMPSLLDVGDTLRLTLNLQNNAAPPGSYRYALKASSGLKLSGVMDGKINFPAKSRNAIGFDLNALEAGNKTLKLDITGPRDFHMSRNWNFAVTEDNVAFTDIKQNQLDSQKSWSSDPQDNTKNKARAKNKSNISTVFVSRQSLFTAPQMLPAFLAAAPITSDEIMSWLESLRLWRDSIEKTGLLSERALQIRVQDTLQRLLKQQNADGGFSPLPGGDSDLVSTSAALIALVQADQPLTQPVADAATNWLRQHLSNTWFDEDERPARAAAFAALAVTNRLDVSSLRYFAETSDGKKLPVLAMAQLALALAKSNDQDKANAWLHLVHEKIDTDATAWPWLAANPLFDPKELAGLLEKMSNDLQHHVPHAPRKISDFLQTIAIINNRAGNWHATLNGADKNQTGILVVTAQAKTTPIAIRNLSDQPLYLITAGPLKETAAATDSSIVRRFYSPDGSEHAANDLKQGGMYVVTLEGGWPDDNNDNAKLFLHSMTEMELRPLSCALDVSGPEAGGWLKNLSLAPVLACETGVQTVDAALSSSNGKNNWRIAYLVRAEYAGSFNLPPATAREADSDKAFFSPAQPVVIK